ncbi:MAG: M23 family metallopeptidase [Actinomycetaceae bacterium]|nr:M23 family metallopeptidase [Actinomycetaceae bacterium]
MGKHSASSGMTDELTVQELSSTLSLAAINARSLRPDAADEGMPAMRSSSSLNLGRSVMHGAIAAVASFAGVTFIGVAMDGDDSSHSNAALQASLDTDFDADFSEIPAALAGSETAQMRSVANDIANEAQTTPMCNTEGATGLRAAYVSTENAVVWPVMSGQYRMVSPFGMRVHPISHTIRMHNGQDLTGRAGTPVYAVADGVVDKVGSDSNNTVRIRHEINGEVFYTAYLHMYRKDILVSVGQKVSAGERIGAIGNAGYSTGPHLHFETHNSAGNPVDPAVFMKKQGAVHVNQLCK